MTALAMSELIGRTANFKPCDGITIPVVVRDVKHAYGDTRVLIAPVHGTGETWVLLRSVQLLDGLKAAAVMVTA